MSDIGIGANSFPAGPGPKLIPESSGINQFTNENSSVHFPPYSLSAVGTRE